VGEVWWTLLVLDVTTALVEAEEAISAEEETVDVEREVGRVLPFDWPASVDPGVDLF